MSAAFVAVAANECLSNHSRHPPNAAMPNPSVEPTLQELRSFRAAHLERYAS